MAQTIRQRLSELFALGKLPISLGGEHSITGPIVAAAHECHPNLAVIHFDAHADLRPEFLNERHSHATAMHQVAATVGPDRIFQFGIRSGTEEEFRIGRHLHPFSVLAPLMAAKPQFQGAAALRLN